MTDVSQRLAKLSPEKLQLLERRLGNSQEVAEPIAIVGMACRLPGAPNIDEYWRVISQGVNAIGEIPESRWSLDELYDPTGEIPGKMSVRHAGMIKDVDKFDAMFFGIAPREAARMDPQQRVLLEVAWEALEVAGMAPERMCGQSTGVFVGIGANDYSKVYTQYEGFYRYIDAHVGTGNALSIAANRVSYLLDLRGPSIAVDTACSSSTMAVHLAVQSLRNRECNSALAGGVNLILTPETTIAFSKAHMLSTDGHCRPFDSGANGYVRGEGCAVLVLKRLTDALKDGDNVMAVIRATAANQDGRTSGITAPNARSQQAVIRAALAQARWMPDRVDYIEAHGTGTPLGDPIEMESLTRVFRQHRPDDNPCYVSSVKANIGHTETVSGVAGIIKIILMMQHSHMPAQLHFEKLNPHISLEGTRLRILDKAKEWPRNGTPRTAGASSFGFGGTNTHVLLEEAATAPTRAVERDRPLHLLAISAKTESALDSLVGRYSKYLVEHSESSLAEVCHTANVGRSHFNHRLAINAHDADEMRAKLDDLAAGKKVPGALRRQSKTATTLKVAFVFTGQGSQYVEMGRSLYETQPTFRRHLDRCDEILQPLLGRSLISVLYPANGESSPLDETGFTQPALFALEYSLAMLWRSWGVEPAVVLGHSVGEYVAASIAGVFSLEHGLQLIAHRARLMQELPGDGMMAVVFAPPERVESALVDLADRVSVAAFNGPDNTVISGDEATIHELLEQFNTDGVRTQALQVSHAFHSPLMEPMLDEFESLAAELKFSAPTIPFISNLTGKLVENTAPGPEYWRDHVRSPVRFAEGIEQLAAQEIHVVLEIGPTSTLLGMARRCLPEAKLAWLPSLRKGQDDWASMLASLSELYTLGAKINWQGFDQDWPRRRLILPTYPFEGTRHWLEPLTPERSHKGVGHGPMIHPLLGSHVPVALDATLYEIRLSSHSPDYLVDHQVQGSPVLPAAAYVEQALAAAMHTFGPGRHQLRDVEFQQAMFLSQGASRVVQTSLATEQRGVREFEISSTPVDSESDVRWTSHASGRLQHADSSTDDASAPIDLEKLRRSAGGRLDQAAFYTQMRERGLAYGPAFQMLGDVAVADREALAELRLPSSIARQLDKYHLHPVLGDALFQSMAGVVPREADGSASMCTYMPVGVRRVRLVASLTDQMFVVARRTSESDQPSPEMVEGDVSLVDADGRLLVEFLGVRVQRVGRAAGGDTATDVRDWLYRVDWPVVALDESTTSKSLQRAKWLVFADDQDVGMELAEKARSLGADPIIVKVGETFGKVPAHNGDVPAYVMNPESGEHYRRLLAETLLASNTAAPVVVHLWSLDIDATTAAISRNADPHGDTSASLADSRRLGTHSALELIRHLARISGAQTPRLVLATRGAQAAADNTTDIATAQSPLWGLGRVAALEHPELRVRLVDLDPADEATTSADRLLQELTTPTDEDQVVYRQGKRHVARLEHAPQLLAQPSEVATRGDTKLPRCPFRLRFAKTGSFDTLGYEPSQRTQPGPGQVELAVHAAGVNFSDVLKVMGLYPGITDSVVPLGIEAAGVVTAVGKGVTQFKVGDEVLGVAPYSLASHALTAEYALVHKPEGVDFREAATIPITFLTAYYALVQLAHLEKGERLLIHAGAGGVGLAAIQIAQHLGAEVFATAGSDEKRDYLRSLGVQHVFSSRTLDFVDEIMEVTGRQGVDVVLNSLPGEAIAASLSVLRAYGRFLEIGKIDIYQNRKIGLLPFQDNLSYFAIDLDRMLRQRPEAVRSLFAEVMEHFASGTYRPLPLTTFEGPDVAGALRYMAERKNIGKVIVSLEREGAESAEEGGDATSSDDVAAIHAKIRPDATYLVSGGLGALGLQVTHWLVSKGARHVAILSRRPATAEATKRFDSLKIAGASIVTLQGDVTDTASLQAALDQMPANFPALRGVIHAAGVLDDGVLFDMTTERFDRVLAPKVEGAWNLHTATLDKPLDFFVLFSSIACVLGSPGQGNYAAGNAFLDALAAHRRFHGLPATSINWGPWAGSGMAAKLDQSDARQGRGMVPIPTAQGLDVLDALLDDGPTNVVVADVKWPELLRILPGRKPSILTAMSADDGAQAAANVASADELDFRRSLAEADFDARVALLRDCLAGELARIMAIDVANLDLDQPLNTIGLDSLMAMELKVVLESRLGFSLPMARFFENPSVASLAIDAAKMVASENADLADGTISASNDRGEHDESANAWSPLIPLQTQGTKLPLFCLHPLGGDVRCYFELTQHLGQQRPVYALTARGMSGVLEPHDSIETMVEDYAAAIRKVQPHGPYHFVGWSTGGVFAYALAHHFVQSGEKPGMVAMLDTPLPSLLKDNDFEDQARFICDYVAFCNRLNGTRMDVSYEELSALSPDKAFEAALNEAKRHEVVPADTSVDFMKRFVNVGQCNARNIKHYTPPLFDAPLHLFRPTEIGSLIELTGKDLPDDLGWVSQLGCQLTTHVTPGDHCTMLVGDHAADLAVAINKCLRSVRSDDTPDALSAMAAS